MVKKPIEAAAAVSEPAVIETKRAELRSNHQNVLSLSTTLPSDE